LDEIQKLFWNVTVIVVHIDVGPYVVPDNF